MQKMNLWPSVSDEISAPFELDLAATLLYGEVCNHFVGKSPAGREILCTLSALVGDSVLLDSGFYATHPLSIPFGTPVTYQPCEDLLYGAFAESPAPTSVFGILAGHLCSRQGASPLTLAPYYAFQARHFTQSRDGSVPLGLPPDQMPKLNPLFIAASFRPKLLEADALFEPNILCTRALLFGLEAHRQLLDPQMTTTLCVNTIIGVTKRFPVTAHNLPFLNDGKRGDPSPTLH